MRCQCCHALHVGHLRPICHLQWIIPERHTLAVSLSLSSLLHRFHLAPPQVQFLTHQAQYLEARNCALVLRLQQVLGQLDQTLNALQNSETQRALLSREVMQLQQGRGTWTGIHSMSLPVSAPTVPPPAPIVYPRPQSTPSTTPMHTTTASAFTAHALNYEDHTSKEWFPDVQHSEWTPYVP